MTSHNFRFLLTDEHGIENVLAWMKGHRLRRRLTQAAVARAMGCSQSYISDLESGRIDMRLSTLLRYARAIGLDPGVDLVEPGDHW